MANIILISKDHQKFKISERACENSRYINNYIIDYPLESNIYFKNISGKALDKIVEYLEHYRNKMPREGTRFLLSKEFKDVVDPWDYDFINIDIDILCEIAKASEFLGIKTLKELSNAKIDSMMKNGTPEENKKLYQKFENVKIDNPKKKSCCIIF